MRPFLVSCFSFALLLSIQIANAQSYGSQEPVLSAKQIREIQGSKEWSNRFVIVDVRAKGETAVSMIPGAITKSEFEKASRQHQGKLVIVYCTVGHRSGIYAKKLKAQGWNAYNYKGSILDWCKNQLPLVTSKGKKTKRVHTYSSRYKAAEGYEAVHR